MQEIKSHLIRDSIRSRASLLTRYRIALVAWERQCDAGRAKGGQEKGEFTKARPSFYLRLDQAGELKDDGERRKA
jgi:hypothetical protein